MIEGDILDEIRSLPEKQIHHHILDSIESKLENNVITEKNALDNCSKLVLDYLENKKQIVADINKNNKIIIIDALMGTGKSMFLINEIINKHPEQHFICVLPTLDECERYSENIKAIVFQPRRYGTKTRDLQRLIAEQKNIVTTHALIECINLETIDLLKKANYSVVIDECLEVIHTYEENFKKSDFDTIFTNNYVTVNDDGFLIWNNVDYKDYNGRYNDIKNLCNMQCLMCLKKQDGTLSKKIIMWNFPVIFFSIFEKCYIATYLWNGSMQKSYFELHNVKYAHMTLTDGKLDVYNHEKELAKRENCFRLIDLYKGSLNNIGIPDYKNKNPLSSTWYSNKAKNENGKNYLTIVKNNTYNYFRNITHSKSEENMYTVFKNYKNFIKCAGYSKGFVPINTKATNKYRNKRCLAYLTNTFPHPNLIRFFESYNIDVDGDLYALSELLQWIWRSRIRDGEKISLFLPSLRMRELLGKWGLGKI